MKKKIVVSFILMFIVAAMAFSMTSCEKLTAASLVLNAVEKTSALDSIEVETEMDIKVSTAGISVDVPMTYTVKASGLKTDSPVILADMETTMLGVNAEVNIYIENGYGYVSMLGQNFKINADEADDYDVVGDVNDTVKPLPTELFNDVEIQDNGDGTKTVTVSVPDETFAEIYDDMLDSISKIAGDTTIESFAVSDAVVAITVNKDGYVDTYNVSCKLKMTMEVLGVSNDADIDMEVSLKYNNPGAVVTITPPEGYQDYPQMDASLLA